MAKGKHKPRPDGLLRLGGNLLPDYGVHERVKEVWPHLPLDGAYTFNGGGQTFVFAGEKVDLFLTVDKILGHFSVLNKVSVSEHTATRHIGATEKHTE